MKSYLQSAEFEEIINQIYDEIGANDLVKHYFVLAKKNVVLQDMKRYCTYLTPKTALDYRRPASPTASVDIQLPETQFAEIIQIIGRILRTRKINPEHAPQLIHEILELTEESRSQTNDTVSAKLEAKEVNVDKIQYFLKRYKIISEVMPSKALLAERGLQHKVWLRIDGDREQMNFEGRIAISDMAFDDQIELILERQANRDSFVDLQLEHDDAGRRRLTARHSLSYRYGIPMRLLVRFLNRFSSDLNQLYSYDKEDILKPA